MTVVLRVGGGSSDEKRGRCLQKRVLLEWVGVRRLRGGRGRPEVRLTGFRFGKDERGILGAVIPAVSIRVVFRM